MNDLQTPIDRAAENEADPAVGDAREEHEADVLIGDIDTYVAGTDPASLPQAEAQLEAWEIPVDPRDVLGTPDVTDDDPLVAVFSAGSEAEANIVLGLLEAFGIPATFDGLQTPIMGTIFSVGESSWSDILVASSRANEARRVIASAGQANPDNESEDIEGFPLPSR